MPQNTYLLVDSAVLPEVFTRVLTAKELLASGKAKNISRAVQMAGISRSAFYKYHNSVFHADTGSKVVTLTATLLDETGALQGLLAGISSAGAGVVTINQSTPENGTATVAATVRIEGMQIQLDELCRRLEGQRTVVQVQRTK